MKPYDPNAKCPKCGSSSINTSWVPLAQCLERSCPKCLYFWAEAPLDVPQETPVTFTPVENMPEGTTGWVVSKWIGDNPPEAPKKASRKQKPAKRAKKAKKAKK